MFNDDELYEIVLAFLNRKYVQRADDRQKALGLQYMEAETHDLAGELARLYVQINGTELLEEGYDV